MKKVLLVDDDDLVRGYFKTLLAQEGYEVLEAGDGQEAVRRCREGKPDLIVMDIFMPKMSGLDAILELDPKKSGIPVIALSGGGAGTGTSPLEMAKSLGAAHTFAKPIDYEEFLRVVKELSGA